jgi:hypothetical protein
MLQVHVGREHEGHARSSRGAFSGVRADAEHEGCREGGSTSGGVATEIERLAVESIPFCQGDATGEPYSTAFHTRLATQLQISLGEAVEDELVTPGSVHKCMEINNGEEEEEEEMVTHVHS